MKTLPIIFLLGTTFGIAQTSKLTPDLVGLGSGTFKDVIVQYKTTPTERHRLRVQALGGAEKHRFTFIKAAHYRLSGRAIANLADDPDVLQISPDYQVTGTLEYARPAVGANIAFQYGYDGSGVGVAIIDSGITSNEDLSDIKGKTRVVYTEDFSAAGTSAKPNPSDLYGHGTHVAGIVGGLGANSTGDHYTRSFIGIAPNVKLVSLKVLGTDGSGNDSAVIAAIGKAIQLKTTYNIRVLNLSLGRPVQQSYRFDPLCQAVEQAYKAGIVVVVAAGNDGRNNTFGTSGYGTISSPGNDPWVITVGAMKDAGTLTTADDTMASYSSKGPTLLDHVVKPDLVAPGNRMISVLANKSNVLITKFPANGIAQSYYTDGSGSPKLSDDYLCLSGTSMAAPMVSGAAALLLQKDPSLTPDQVKARLMRTAGKVFPRYSTVTDPASGSVYTTQYDVFTVGAGYLNVWAALNDQEKGSGTAGSPTVTFNKSSAKTLVTYTVLGNQAVWGDQAVWGSQAIWGSSAVWGDQAIWGDSVLVGSASGVSGSSAVWGDQAVWGDNTNKAYSVLWGSTAIWGSRATSNTESLDITSKGEN